MTQYKNQQIDFNHCMAAGDTDVIDTHRGAPTRATAVQIDPQPPPKGRKAGRFMMWSLPGRVW